MCYDRYIKQGGLPVVNAFVRHDDYETFASYLGVEYEDYYNLQLSIPDDDLDEFDEVKVQVASFA